MADILGSLHKAKGADRGESATVKSNEEVP